MRYRLPIVICVVNAGIFSQLIIPVLDLLLRIPVVQGPKAAVVVAVVLNDLFMQAAVIIGKVVEIHGLSVFPQIVHRAAYLSLGNVPPGNIVALIPADIELIKESGRHIDQLLIREQAVRIIHITQSLQHFPPPLEECHTLLRFFDSQKAQIIHTPGIQLVIPVKAVIEAGLRREPVRGDDDIMLIQHLFQLVQAVKDCNIRVKINDLILAGEFKQLERAPAFYRGAQFRDIMQVEPKGNAHVAVELDLIALEHAVERLILQGEVFRQLIRQKQIEFGVRIIFL